MKYLVYLFLFTFLYNSNVIAQIQIGDLTVSKMSDFFDPNNANLWKEEQIAGIYKLKEEKSEIWVENQVSGLVLKHSFIKNSQVSFSADLSYEQDKLIEELSSKLNNQFGEFVWVEFDRPYGAEKLKMMKWVYIENEYRYEIQLGKLARFTNLSITQFDK